MCANNFTRKQLWLSPLPHVSVFVWKHNFFFLFLTVWPSLYTLISNGIDRATFRKLNALQSGTFRKRQRHCGRMHPGLILSAHAFVPLNLIVLPKVGVSVCFLFLLTPPLCFVLFSGAIYKWTCRYHRFSSGVFRASYRKVGWSKSYLYSSHKGSMSMQR